jgi:L-arabinose isomerase
VEILEVDELSALRASVSDDDIARRVQDIHAQFDVQSDCLESELERAARTSAALDNFVPPHHLNAFAYYYEGSGNEVNEDTMSSMIVGTSLLTSRNIPVAGEYEVKNLIAMKIMDAFGVGGSFTEYYALDYDADVVLMGHDGPGHIVIAEGKTKIRPLEVYHGKVGRGLSVEMPVRYGPVPSWLSWKTITPTSSYWLLKENVSQETSCRSETPTADTALRLVRVPLWKSGTRRGQHTIALSA